MLNHVNTKTVKKSIKQMSITYFSTLVTIYLLLQDDVAVVC